MALDRSDTQDLVERASQGDKAAREELLERHRERLLHMVSVHMDQRILRRFDPSDVVQDTFAKAWQNFSEFLKQRAIPFYPWLRNLAWKRLIELHRTHVLAQRRSVNRERHLSLGALSIPSSLELAGRLSKSLRSPSGEALREELRSRVKEALDRLPEHHREILVLRYLEELPLDEAAAVLEVPKETAKKRHLRALQQLRASLAGERRPEER
jgi:RNA polymerase sigma-70 factor (ECF subfamily)